MKLILIIIGLSFVLVAGASASLKFQTTTTDNVTVNFSSSVHPSLMNVSNYTIISWVRPICGVASGNTQIISANDAGFNYIQLRIKNCGPLGINMTWQINNASGFTGAYTASDNTLMNNTWGFVASTWNQANASGNMGHVYIGNRSTLATEVAYFSQTDAPGVPRQPASGSVMVGTRIGANPFAGEIGVLMYINRTLNLSEIRATQYTMLPPANTVMFMHLGSHGVIDQPDWSGFKNSGSIMTATVSSNPPIPMRFRR